MKNSLVGFVKMRDEIFSGSTFCAVNLMSFLLYLAPPSIPFYSFSHPVIASSVYYFRKILWKNVSMYEITSFKRFITVTISPRVKLSTNPIKCIYELAKRYNLHILFTNNSFSRAVILKVENTLDEFHLSVQLINQEGTVLLFMSGKHVCARLGEKTGTASILGTNRK